MGTIDLDYVQTLNATKLAWKKMLHAQIQTDELKAAAFVLVNNKVCGCDGIPIDWIKVFHHKLSDFLLHLFREIAQTKELYLSARRGLITLLEKSCGTHLVS